MPIQCSTIHSIKRSSVDKDIEFSSATPNSNTSEPHQCLLDNLKRAFHLHSKKQFGYFEQEQKSNNPLPDWLSDYYQENISFEQLSRKIAALLQQQFTQLPSSTLFEHYLWIVTEHESPRNDIYIFLLKHDDCHHVSKQLCVEDSYNINPDKLQYAAKIDLDDYVNEQSKTYLSFLSLKTRNAITRVFNSLVEFSEGVNRASQTDDFLEVVEQYANEFSDSDHECRHRIIDYCLEQDRQGEPVELQALSKHVDNSDPQAFMSYLADHLDQPATELYPDRNRLRRYTRFYGRDQDLSISFSTVRFGNNITYDEQSETLTISAIPESLKAQLKKYLNKAG